MFEVLLMFMVFFGVAGSAAGLAWLLFSSNGIRSLRKGTHWEKRLERLEAEVKSLRDQETRLDVEDEVHRLDEKVAFLEDLLAERPGTGALPPGAEEDPRRVPRKP